MTPYYVLHLPKTTEPPASVTCHTCTSNCYCRTTVTVEPDRRWVIDDRTRRMVPPPPPRNRHERRASIHR